jgi:hypothetical protein
LIAILLWYDLKVSGRRKYLRKEFDVLVTGDHFKSNLSLFFFESLSVDELILRKQDPIGATEVVPIIGFLKEAESVWVGYKLCEMIEVIQNVEKTVAVGQGPKTSMKCVQIALSRKLIAHAVQILRFSGAC